MSIIDEYSGVGSKVDRGPVKAEVSGSNPIPRAVPKVSDYRERYKKKKLTMADVVAPPSKRKLKNRGNDLKSQFPGMIFGPGLEEEF